MVFKIKESHEDYLKAIYLISKGHKGGWCSNSEIANFLKVKGSSVTNMLYKLREKELIVWQPRKSLRLTMKGKSMAEDLIRNYNCLFDLFVKVFGTEHKNLAKKLSCKIEHYITSELLNDLDHFVYGYL